MTTIDKKVVEVPVKVAISVVVSVVLFVGWYFKRDYDYQKGIERAQEISLQNNAILKEMRTEWKEERRINEVRLKQIESNIQRQDVEIAILKVKLGI